ncbi:MAG: hypothetical protein ACK41O_00565 [Runella zeae]
MNTELHDRRGFLKQSVLTSLAGLVGTDIVFAENMPKHHVPLALDEGLKGKHPDMIVLSDKPWNVETPPHLLNDAVTPIDRMFIRNNGLVPEEKIDPTTWTLT